MWDGIYHGMLRRVSILRLLVAAGRGTRIKVETDRLLIIRRRHAIHSWCPQCGEEVDMVCAEEAAALVETLRLTLPNCLAKERWHITRAPGGSPLICLDSLLKSLCEG
jgi:hypothetical protein